LSSTDEIGYSEIIYLRLKKQYFYRRFHADSIGVGEFDPAVIKRQIGGDQQQAGCADHAGRRELLPSTKTLCESAA
jgi:hypothetical protein